MDNDEALFKKMLGKRSGTAGLLASIVTLFNVSRSFSLNLLADDTVVLP